MIALACDHSGVDLKEAVIEYLTEHGYEVKDFGCYDKTSCDYPNYARPAAKAVASGECEYGIVICTTGIGISMVANKVKGIRCALLDFDKKISGFAKSSAILTGAETRTSSPIRVFLSSMICLPASLSLSMEAI